MKTNRENPFKYLRRKSDDKAFETSVVKSWYIARAYVLQDEQLKNVAFTHDSNEFLHVIIPNDTPQMLYLARQIALSAHYINFREEMGENAARTRITIISNNPNIKQELEKEEYLCNLPKFCNYVDKEQGIENKGSYIDIEIEIANCCPTDEGNKNTIIINKESVNAFFYKYIDSSDDADIFKIDTRKAVFASRMYELGGEIHNLPAEDIHCAKTYAMALDVYQHEKLKCLTDMVDSDKWSTMSLCRIKEHISNILCSDCFRSRFNCIKQCNNKSNSSLQRIWEQYNEALSRSEHARWVTEKLILGYRPLNEDERYQDEILHVQFNGKQKKKIFRDSLKRNDKDPAHIDLCSYTDLRRINPDDMKYDSFLMLAIPKILDKVGEND